MLKDDAENEDSLKLIHRNDLNEIDDKILWMTNSHWLSSDAEWSLNLKNEYYFFNVKISESVELTMYDHLSNFENNTDVSQKIRTSLIIVWSDVYFYSFWNQSN